MTVPIVSWNISGLHDPLKRTMVSTALCKHLPAICALQETHLTSETVSCLNFAWVGKAYHSIHTNYSRGVSVLIPGSLDIQELGHSMDTEGRYVFLVCRIYNLQCILAIIYNPSPFNSDILRDLLMYQLGYPDMSLFVLGDFNCYLDPELAKRRIKTMGTGGTLYC